MPQSESLFFRLWLFLDYCAAATFTLTPGGTGLAAVDYSLFLVAFLTKTATTYRANLLCHSQTPPFQAGNLSYSTTMILRGR
jgi:hypothetical protein